MSTNIQAGGKKRKSLFSRSLNTGVTGFNAFANELKDKLASNKGLVFSNESFGNRFASLEDDTAIDGAFENDLEAAEGEAVTAIDEAVTDSLGQDYEPTEAQIDAAVTVALSQESLEKYFHRRLATTAKGGDGVQVIAAPSGFGYMDIATEAFDARHLDKFFSQSVAFNFGSARQLEFGETLYPTMVLTPEQTGFDLTIRRPMVMNPVRHKLTGQHQDYGRRNLIDAFIDPTVLADDSTKIVPVWSDENAEYFAAGVTPRDVVANGVEYKTAPYATGKVLNIKNLMQNAALLATGQADQNSAIDLRANLTHIWLRFGVNGANVVPVNVTGLRYTQFTQESQGAIRQIQCHFRSDDILINANTKDQTEQAAPVAAFFTGARERNYVRLSVDGIISLNTEDGRFSASLTTAEVHSVWTADAVTGQQSQVSDAAEITAFKDQFGKIEVTGVDILSTRANLDRRQEGLIGTIYEEVIRYVVPLGMPITIQTPVTNTRTDTDVSLAVAMARARNENNAVTQLLRFEEQLKAIKPLLDPRDRSVSTPLIEGIGQTVVYPFYEEIDLDLASQTAGLRSFERQEDVSSTIVNQIRELAYRMHLDSGWQLAAESAGDTNAKPLLIIATDPQIHRHLMVTGDTRLAGIYFDYKVVSTMDIRVRDRIYLTLTRTNPGHPHPLLFGAMAWIPELITSLLQPRNGGTTKETMVQPRSLHVNFCPILARINVKGLKEAVTGRLPVNMALSTVSNP